MLASLPGCSFNTNDFVYVRHAVKNFTYISLLLLLFSFNIFAKGKYIIIVDAGGKGDFKTISEAIKSLPMFNYERKIIKIMNGIYAEKFKIDQDNITLIGESKDSTIIRYSQLREDWNNNKDEIGPAVINLNGDDIIIKNLTVENTQPEIGPHAFAIYGKGTRTIILNCNLISKGADTVSLWDYKTGMYYHADNYFEGAVDFVCPRGWCFIKNSKFYEVKKTAALWHAGGYNRNQKFVIKDSYFDGVKNFDLGRHHYEAQFYLLNCTFSENMSSQKIFRVTYEDTTRNRPFNWGERYYFYNCSRKGGNYDWIQNNLDEAEGNPSLNDITPAWTFDYMWDPESNEGPKIYKHEINGKNLKLFFDENITVLNDPVLLINKNESVEYSTGGGSDTLVFCAESEILEVDLKELKLVKGKLIATKASVNEREVVFDIE